MTTGGGGRSPTEVCAFHTSVQQFPCRFCTSTACATDAFRKPSGIAAVRLPVRTPVRLFVQTGWSKLRTSGCEVHRCFRVLVRLRKSVAGLPSLLRCRSRFVVHACFRSHVPRDILLSKNICFCGQAPLSSGLSGLQTLRSALPSASLLLSSRSAVRRPFHSGFPLSGKSSTGSLVTGSGPLPFHVPLQAFRRPKLCFPSPDGGTFRERLSQCLFLRSPADPAEVEARCTSLLPRPTFKACASGSSRPSTGVPANL